MRAAHRMWVAVLLAMTSQLAMATMCTVTVTAQPSPTRTSYVFTTADNLACDHLSNGLYGIQYGPGGNEINSTAETTPVSTAHGGVLYIFNGTVPGTTNPGPGLQSGFTYYPPPGFSGTDTGTFYTSEDGSAWNANGTVVFNVPPPPVPPTVTGIAPTSGATAGGTAVTITGTNFTGSTSVKFGATTASFIINSATSISATSPAGSAGTVDVTVTNGSGTSPTSAADQYTYVAPPVASPGSATVTYGTPKVISPTITGSPTSVTVSTPPTHGTTTVSGLNITYTPTAGYAGPDTLSYTAANGGGSSTPAAITITVSSPTITYAPANPAGGTVGVNYSQSVASASGGAPTYTYALAPASGALPPGISLGSNGTLSGTPTGSGSYSFTIRATDSSTGTGPFFKDATVSLNIAAPTLSLSPPSGGLSATAGSAFSQSFTPGGGTTPYSYAITVTAGTLPAGVTFNTTNGMLSGTPTSAGTASFNITATDSSVGAGGQFQVTNSYTLTTAAPTITVTTASLPNPAIGSAYNQTIAASGGASPYSFAVTSGSLPPGLTLGTNGALTGTPTGIGTFPVTVTATDTHGFTGSRGYTLNVAAPTISISPTSVPGAATGSAYSQTLTPSGGTAPYTFTVTPGTLPAGMTLSSAGVLAGTPTVGGSFNFTVQVSDSTTGGTFTASQPYTLTVSAATLTVLPATIAGATVGTAYSQTLSTSGGTPSYTYAITAGVLPAGLQLSTAGVITGTPTQGGSFNFTVTSTDSSGGTGPFAGSTPYTLTVAAATVTVNPAALPAPAVGISYSQTLSGSGGTAPYTFAVTAGVLPAGLSLNPTSGMLSGTPTSGGAFNFTVTATDSSSGTGPYTNSRAYSGAVGAAAITVNPAALPAPTVASAYNQTLSAVGGTAPYTFVVTSGTLPPGVTLSTTGVLSGTPTAGGTFNFTVTATDSSSGAGPYTGNRPYTLVSGSANVTLAPATLQAPTVGIAYSQTFTAGGGIAPYTYSVSSGTLPAGLTLNASTGVLSGTPTTSGSSTFAIKVTDSSTGTGAPFGTTRSFTLSTQQGIGSAPPVTTAARSDGSVTINAIANATNGPFQSVKIVAQPASGTATVQNFDIVYKPAATSSGPVNFTYALVNAAGTSAPIQVTVNVTSIPVPVATKQATTVSGKSVTVDVTDGATGGPFTAATLVSVVPSNAGTATVAGAPSKTTAAAGKQLAAAGSDYSITFTPAPAFAGTAVITYTISNANATSANATLQIAVAARRDPSTDPDVSGLINAQIQAARRFATAQITNYNQRLEQLHGNGRAAFSNGLTVAMPQAGGGDSRACQGVQELEARDACMRGTTTTRRGQATRGSGTASAGTGDGNAGSVGSATQPGFGETGNSLLAALGVPGTATDAGAGPNSSSGKNGGNVPDLPGTGDTPAGRADDPRLAFWTAGTVDFGFANVGAQRSGFRFTTGGVTAGADYRVSDQLTVGAGIGYGHDATDIGSFGTHTSADAVSVALYGSYRPAPSYFVDGVAGYGALNYDSRRWVIDEGAFANGKRDGHQLFASLTTGYEYRDTRWLISPYGRVLAAESTLDPFTESGAGIGALTYFGQTVTTFSGSLGLRTEFAQPTRWGMFLPFARVEYQHDFEGQSAANIAYADLASAGPAYTVFGTPFGRDRIQVWLGTKLRTKTVTFGFDYNVMFGMSGLQQGVRLTIAAPF